MALSEHPWEKRTFRRNQHLVRNGQQPSCLFRVESGWACRYHQLKSGRRQISALFLPGEYCEPQWIWGGSCNGSIIALTEVKAVAVPLDGSELPVRKRASVRAATMPQILGLLSRQAEWIVSLGRKSALQRVSGLFLELSERIAAQRLGAADLFEMPLTQNDIADVTGLTPVHINRIVMRLRAREIIDLQRRRLRILDPDMLRMVSQGLRE